MTTGWPQNQQDLRWPYSDTDETGAGARADGGVATDSESSDRSGPFGGFGTEHPSGPLPVTPAPSRGRLGRKSRDSSRGGAGSGDGLGDADYDWIRYLGEAGPAQEHSRGPAESRPPAPPDSRERGRGAGRGFSRRHAAPEPPAEPPVSPAPAADFRRSPRSDGISRLATPPAGRRAASSPSAGAAGTAGLGAAESVSTSFPGRDRVDAAAESATTSFPVPGRPGRRGRAAQSDALTSDALTSDALTSDALTSDAATTVAPAAPARGRRGAQPAPEPPFGGQSITDHGHRRRGAGDGAADAPAPDTARPGERWQPTQRPARPDARRPDVFRPDAGGTEAWQSQPRADAPGGFGQPDAGTSAWPSSPAGPRPEAFAPGQSAPRQYPSAGYQPASRQPAHRQPGGPPVAPRAVEARLATPELGERRADPGFGPEAGAAAQSASERRRGSRLRPSRAHVASLAAAGRAAADSVTDEDLGIDPRLAREMAAERGRSERSRKRGGRKAKAAKASKNAALAQDPAPAPRLAPAPSPAAVAPRPVPAAAPTAFAATAPAPARGAPPATAPGARPATAPSRQPRPGEVKRVGRASGRRKSRRSVRLAIGGGAVVVVAIAAVAATEMLTGSGGPAHQISTPPKLFAYVQNPQLASGLGAEALRAEIVKKGNGEASHVVDAVYEDSTGAVAKSGPQIILFVGGNLSGSAGSFITSFTGMLPGAFVTGPGKLGGQAACVPGTGGHPSECAWADNDTFGLVASPNLSATALGSELRTMRPLVERTVR